MCLATELFYPDQTSECQGMYTSALQPILCSLTAMLLACCCMQHKCFRLVVETLLFSLLESAHKMMVLLDIFL